jgi:hypothetical protein
MNGNVNNHGKRGTKVAHQPSTHTGNLGNKGDHGNASNQRSHKGTLLLT